MQIKILDDIDGLDTLTGDVYVYGAGTIAGKLYHRFMRTGKTISGFLVSNRYKNPDFLWGKPVYKIENCSDKYYKCVILAVGQMLIEDCIKTLSSFNIEQLLVISYLLDKKLNGEFLLNRNCFISENASISPDTIIYADETSEVHIDSYVCMGGGDIIATNHSKIKIGKNLIAENIHVCAANESSILLGERIKIGTGTTIDAVDKSNIEIGAGTTIGYNTEIGRRYGIKPIKLGHGCYVGHDCSLGGDLLIGDYSGFGEFSALSEALVGKNCMFSTFIRFIGNHTMIDENGQDITNRDRHVIKDHVWAGMGATFMPGCIVGSGSIVGTSAMVMGNIPNNVVCVGMPARIVRENVKWKE